MERVLRWNSLGQPTMQTWRPRSFPKSQTESGGEALFRKGLEEDLKIILYPFEYGEILHQEVEDTSQNPDSTQIRSLIQTQQLDNQETGSGCHWKSNNDFEKSARLDVWDGVSIHQSTISHSLRKAGLHGQVARKKAFLNKTQLKACVKFSAGWYCRHVEKHFVVRRDKN